MHNFTISDVPIHKHAVGLNYVPIKGSFELALSEWHRHERITDSLTAECGGVQAQ